MLNRFLLLTSCLILTNIAFAASPDKSDEDKPISDEGFYVNSPDTKVDEGFGVTGSDTRIDEGFGPIKPATKIETCEQAKEHLRKAKKYSDRASGIYDYADGLKFYQSARELNKEGDCGLRIPSAGARGRN